MLKALRTISNPASDWAWARPVSWRGTGQAICYTPNAGWELVPHRRGGMAASLPKRADCFGEWEVVDPSVVNMELR